MFYMHKNAMDVCVEVVKVTYQDSERIKLKVRWWTLGYSGTPFLTYDGQVKNVTIENPNDWVCLTRDQVNQKRLSPGLPK